MTGEVLEPTLVIAVFKPKKGTCAEDVQVRPVLAKILQRCQCRLASLDFIEDQHRFAGLDPCLECDLEFMDDPGNIEIPIENAAKLPVPVEPDIHLARETALGELAHQPCLAALPSALQDEGFASWRTHPGVQFGHVFVSFNPLAPNVVSLYTSSGPKSIMRHF